MLTHSARGCSCISACSGIASIPVYITAFVTSYSTASSSGVTARRTCSFRTSFRIFNRSGNTLYIGFFCDKAFSLNELRYTVHSPLSLFIYGITVLANAVLQENSLFLTFFFKIIAISVNPLPASKLLSLCRASLPVIVKAIGTLTVLMPASCHSTLYRLIFILKIIVNALNFLASQMHLSGVLRKIIPISLIQKPILYRLTLFLIEPFSVYSFPFTGISCLCSKCFSLHQNCRQNKSKG